MRPRSWRRSNGQARLKASLDPHGHPLLSPAAHSGDAGCRAAAVERREVRRREGVAERIRQLEAFQKEMEDFQPVFPTVTFGKTYVIKDKVTILHVEFHGRAHTSGDVVVFCPQKRVVATGDMVPRVAAVSGGQLPTEWPKTIDSVSKLPFDYVIGVLRRSAARAGADDGRA